MHVADTENHRIQVFTADGDYLRQFGRKGKSRGELDQPKGIAINCNDIVMSASRAMIVSHSSLEKETF